MSDSLKDQLKALGLAPKPAKRDHKRPARQHKPKPARAAKTDPDNISLDQAYRMRSQQERQQKQQAIERKQEEQRMRREINQKIKALVNEHAEKDKAAEIKRNFLYKGRIRSVLVNPEQLKQINEGALAVVYLSGNHHLMPVEIVEQVRGFAPDNVPNLQGSQSAEEEDNPVPDDLIW